MALSDFWSKTKSKTSSWLQAHKPSQAKDYPPEVDDEGLISEESELETPAPTAGQATQAQDSPVVVKTVQPVKKQEPIERLQEGFNRLIDQLQGINEHLKQQANQHEDLMSRIDRLPRLLESLPDVVTNQKHTVEQLIEQLKTAATKQEQFIEAVEKIPSETAKQTDALVEIDHQLAAAADTDVQMAESLNKFNVTLDKLNESTRSQIGSINQMSKTFATSDRYLKYLITKQNRRFAWIFVTAIVVCVAAILILTSVVVYLTQY